MEKQSGPKSLSVISPVSAVEGCPLSGVPLYYHRAIIIVDSMCKDDLLYSLWLS